MTNISELRPMKPYSILHISDLHRSPHDPISNDELISALVGDRERYIDEDPRIVVPEAIVVSGDIVQGVPLGTNDHERKLAEQYSVAEEFLDELVRRWNERKQSSGMMVLLGKEDFIQKLKGHVKGYEKIAEIPRQQRHLGRPRLKTLFEGKFTLTKIKRDARIVEAVHRYGYSQREVTDILDLHYTTVSRLANRC